MQKFVFGTLTVVWLILMIATGFSWTLRSTEFPADFTVQMVTVSLFLVAMVKVRLVILYFMEMRTAPLALRLVFEAWIAVVGSGLIGIYLLG